MMQRHPAAPSDRTVLEGAATAAAINGLINGAIQFFLLKDHAPLPLSLDMITNDARTVLGQAVPLAVVLAMVLTIIGHMTLKAPKQNFWPHVPWLTLRHGLAVFCVVVSGAILWQRLIGSVEVSLIQATFVISIIAGIVAGAVNYMTVRASLLPQTANAFHTSEG